MAEKRLNPGASSLNAANWPAGVGFANAAELAIVDSDKVHADLDRTADTTTGINYLHIRGNAPTVGDDTNGDLIVEFDPAYTTQDNFVWATRAGKCRLQAAANICRSAVFMAGGGDAFLVSGSFDNIKVSGKMTLHILAGVDINTALYATGACKVLVYEKSGDSVPAVYAGENALVDCRRRIDNLRNRQNARTLVDNRSGTGMTDCLIEGGVVVPIAGDIPTVTWWGGRLDPSRIAEALSFGTTAFALNGSGLVVPSSNSLLTVGTPTGLLPAVPVGI